MREGLFPAPTPTRRLPEHGVGAPLTERLELVDAGLREWDAVVLDATPDEVVLNRSAFYPGGGGQPPDYGLLRWEGTISRVTGTRRAEEHFVQLSPGDPVPPAGTAVRGVVDSARRDALMRTHSALHLVSGVIYRDFGAMVTGGNMEPLSGRLDFDLPEIPPRFRELVEEACAEEIRLARPIRVDVLPREEAERVPGLVRTVTNAVVPTLRDVRVVEIVGLDVQADGGTHVSSTAEIGTVRVVKVDNKGKANRRIRIEVAPPAP